MLLPRGMLGRNVQRIEIVEVVLDVRAFGHGEAEVAENLHHLFPHLGDGMNGAGDLRPHRQRHVDLLGGEPRLKRDLLQLRLAARQGLRHLVLQHVEGGARLLALLGAHGAQALHALGDRALLAERGDAHGFECCLVGCGVDLGKDRLFESGENSFGCSPGNDMTGHRVRGRHAVARSRQSEFDVTDRRGLA